MTGPEAPRSVVVAGLHAESLGEEEKGAAWRAAEASPPRKEAVGGPSDLPEPGGAGPGWAEEEAELWRREPELMKTGLKSVGAGSHDRLRSSMMHAAWKVAWRAVAEL